MISNTYELSEGNDCKRRNGFDLYNELWRTYIECVVMYDKALDIVKGK